MEPDGARRRAGGSKQNRISQIERGSPPAAKGAAAIAAAFSSPIGEVFPEHAALDKVPEPPAAQPAPEIQDRAPQVVDEATVTLLAGLQEKVERLEQQIVRTCKAMDCFVQLLAKSSAGLGLCSRPSLTLTPWRARRR